MKKFVLNVIVYNFNEKKFDTFDIMLYFRQLLLNELTKKHARRKNNFPKNRDDLKAFIVSNSIQQFWCKAEWEIIIKSWPTMDVEQKIDVHRQITMNIDLITELFAQEFKIKN